MTDLEDQHNDLGEQTISQRNQKPSKNPFVLFIMNFMTYWIVQTLLSVVLVTGYAILSLVMEHNVCRFDKSQYFDDPWLEVHDDPEKYPNVTITVQICFIVGLILHVLLFFLNVFYEPHFRFFKIEVEQPVDNNWLEDRDP